MNQFTTPSYNDAATPHADDDVDQLLYQLDRIHLKLEQWSELFSQKATSTDIDGRFSFGEQMLAQMESTQDIRPYIDSEDVYGNGWSNDDANECTLLDKLVINLSLTDFERDALLLGLLPYFNSRYLTWFASLQGSPNKKSPSFEFALDLLCSSSAEKIVQEASFLPQSPLLNHRLIRIVKKGEQQGDSWKQSLFQTDLFVYFYLTGRWYLPESFEHCVDWLPLPVSPEDCCVPAVDAGMDVQLACESDEVKPVLMLRGPIGSGRALAVSAAAMLRGRETLELDLATLPENDLDAQSLLVHVLREVRMRAAWLLIRSLESLPEDRKELLATFSKQLNQTGLLVICLCETQTGILKLPNQKCLMLDMPTLSIADKETLLRRSLEKYSVSEINIEDFCRRQNFTKVTLPGILKEAQYYAIMRDPTSSLCNKDLYKSFRIRSQQSFGNMARRIEPKRTFSDLVVGEDLRNQLSEILIAAKHRSQVLEMGFAEKISYGVGISALFYGDSGTGKTMAAEVIAGHLGVDVIQVDLASVVSKYIGETEKNLARIFDLAEADAGVLFFDEADALFGKRSAVKDSKDRHANIEVAYLLQRLENYPGLVILATNNRGHLDEAFSRRFTFITKFTFPDVELRERLWRNAWPNKIGIADEVDFAMLAARGDLTGANIRNIALLASWLATEESSSKIFYRHIERAMQRELGKIGRLAR